MEYRPLGRTGLQVSVIGLGTEHLVCTPQTADAVMGMAVDAGISYIDLLYHDSGGVGARFWRPYGPALRAHRDQLIVALHWGGALDYDLEYCRRSLDDDLACLGNGRAEVGLVTMIDTETRWQQWGLPSIDILQRYKDEGRIGAIGVSSHHAPMAARMAESGLIDVLMHPQNLTSHLAAANSAVLQACRDHGVGLVAMKPYAGGMLFVAEGKAGRIRPAQCLAYVLSLPVATTVPGPRNAREMRAIVGYLGASPEEKDYGAVLEGIGEYVVGQCLYCNHCLPCPQEVDIGQMMHLADAAQYYVRDEIVAEYAALPVKASSCTECGVCLERCPYQVDVVAKMHQVVEFFGS